MLPKHPARQTRPQATLPLAAPGCASPVESRRIARPRTDELDPPRELRKRGRTPVCPSRALLREVREERPNSVDPWSAASIPATASARIRPKDWSENNNVNNFLGPPLIELDRARVLPGVASSQGGGAREIERVWIKLSAQGRCPFLSSFPPWRLSVFLWLRECPAPCSAPPTGAEQISLASSSWQARCCRHGRSSAEPDFQVSTVP